MADLSGPRPENEAAENERARDENREIEDSGTESDRNAWDLLGAVEKLFVIFVGLIALAAIAIAAWDFIGL